MQGPMTLAHARRGGSPGVPRILRSPRRPCSTFPPAPPTWYARGRARPPRVLRPAPSRRSETRMIGRILRPPCCGNGTCSEIAPGVFALDSKNKSTVLDAEAADRATLIEAAEACPCSAIVIEDDEGNVLFP